MNLVDALNIRKSQRTYISTPLDLTTIQILENEIQKINEHTGLHIQLILNQGAAFKGFTRSYGLLKNVQHYIALVGKDNEACKEQLGYYGEYLVLLATQHHLGTCFVGGSYDRKQIICNVNQSEKIHCLITLGNVLSTPSKKDLLISKLLHRKSKSLEALSNYEPSVPAWFKEGMLAVQKAPSAINKQPVYFTYHLEGVEAITTQTTNYSSIDLGIAKLNFELGASKASFDVFHPQYIQLKKQ